MLRSTSTCLPTAPPAAQRFKSLTATHTPGTLELNMVAPQPSEATPQSSTSQQELIMAGQQQSAPQSISASIAANGKDTDRIDASKTAARGGKAASSPAIAGSSQIKEKRGRPGRPPKHSKNAKDSMPSPGSALDTATL